MLVTVLIPAHNEAGTIASVVNGCISLGLGLRVVVVADHCTDNTAELALRAGAEVWENTGRCGKASALRGAWSRLMEQPHWTHLLLLDGDGQHDPREIPRLLATIGDNGLVIGSRAPFQTPMPRSRQWINRIMSRILSFQTGQPIPDSQSGFRIILRRLVEQGKWTSVRFEMESEMIREAVRLGLPVAHIPVTCRYGGRASHIQGALDTWLWLAWLGRSVRQS